MGGHVGPRAAVSAPAPELAAFLREHRLAGEHEEGEWTALAGGVSSDIWRVRTSAATFCVKRALAQLKVAAEWTAPLDRNAYEWEYMKVAGAIVPGGVPAPIVHDEARGLFAMEWLSPGEYRLWKTELLAGRVSIAAAAAVGTLIGRVHAATAKDTAIAFRFATDGNFHSLRIEPYLLATARKHADLSERLHEIADVTAATRLVLVHGDVSPKNILLGPRSPVLLDAECAWYGDPAFDLAFCLNHLIIKAGVLGDVSTDLRQAAQAMASRYLAHVGWEPASGLEARAAALLPALALARVDGMSPLEYLNEGQRSRLRNIARRALAANPQSLQDAMNMLLPGTPG